VAQTRPRGVSALKITDAKTLVKNGYLYYRLYTDAGLTGIGEPSHSNAELNATFLEMIKPMIVGMDAFQIERIWEKLYVGLYKTRGQSASMAISGVDIALHDLVGKALGVPVYQLLGGLYRERVPMYASFTSRERTPVEQARLCAGAIEKGYSATKIKIAARHRFDAEPSFPDEDRVREARAAVGGQVKLMVDANSGYSVPHAIRIGRMLERYDCFWFEEPVAFTDYHGTAQVAATLDIAIAGGEQDHTRYDFQKLLAAEALDIVQADPVKAGGISECKKIAAMTDACGRVYIPHDTSHAIGLAACLHLAASTPVCRYAHEYVTEPSEERPVLTTPLVPDKGFLRVPDGPGLGVEIAD
jgi:L-alanine-DL-glutamate epimerase-like enolase superfamily enzyme